MNKKRLEEIRDSIDFQLIVANSIGVRDEIVDEEKELYDYVIQLKQRIYKVLHRIQLLQMDNEVTIKDLGLIVKDLTSKEESNGEIITDCHGDTVFVDYK